ncbi:uncharacterized protein FA14DRAFT_193147 [Meira miltonrushii]|uniref:Uncharacterized protein n=1 Tax=Meira miltonrushii TaxID=1280837 RepID=A0A316V117_9BASI|nr:uncharacterized protein FA14DRAFT_193147 [Meira miltonrushii]PWN31247.1 hypothetical protein FA14DRAFT_193147 [Meira miltonrushii]
MAEVLPIQNVVDAATAKIHSASAMINPAGTTTTTTNTNAALANPLPSTNTSNRLGRSAKQTSNSNAKAAQPVRKVRLKSYLMTINEYGSVLTLNSNANAVTIIQGVFHCTPSGL